MDLLQLGIATDRVISMQKLADTIPAHLLKDKIFNLWFKDVVAPREASRIEMYENLTVDEALREIAIRHSKYLREDNSSTLLTKYVENIYKPLYGLK